MSQGSRSTAYGYDAKGRVATVTDPLARTVTFAYDTGDRVTEQTFPDGRSVNFTYDASDNVTSITPPSRPAHTFGYDVVERPAEARAPEVDGQVAATRFEYDGDGALQKVLRPDGSELVTTRDSAGRARTLTHPDGTLTYEYDGAARLSSVSSDDGNQLEMTYDGPLPTRAATTGPAAGDVTWSYDNDLRVASTSVNGGTIAYGYNNDSLLTSAGAETIVRDAATGRISSTTTGSVATAHTYDLYGAPSAFSAGHGGNSLYSTSFTRDLLGRIAQRVETLAGETYTYDYDYDPAGRLKEVRRGGLSIERYHYDENGNRTSATVGGASETGRYDDQDRLRSYAGRSYSYARDGQLNTIKTADGAITDLDYDALGALRHVRLPDGRQIDYVIDPAGRRVGKRIDDRLVQRFVYDGARIAAELNADGSVRSRFVYATAGHVPDYMIRGGATYRFIGDHLGSPRLIVNAATGEIAQSLSYDHFGRNAEDTNPGFQPFGYAGGLVDHDTDLIRFGARDYDPATGRWTAKDPLGFNAGDPNHYAYVSGDPVNYVDPSGNIAFLAAGLIAVEIGIAAYDINKAIHGCGSALDLGLAAAGPMTAGATWLIRAGRAADDIPSLIFREGSPSPSNLRVRQGEEAVSFRDSISNPWIPPADRPPGWRPVLRPGQPYFGVDTTKLPAGSVIPDGVPPGHVSVIGVDPSTLKDAVDPGSRGKFPK